jgi:hypothetical protein
MAEDRGPWLSVATALFFGWAFLSCCVRVWVSVGRKQSWGHADTGAVSAVVRPPSRVENALRSLITFSSSLSCTWQQISGPLTAAMDALCVRLASHP